MKHLFYIHSYITEIVAKQLISHEKLNTNDCIFLLARNHQSTFINCIPFPYTHYPIDSFRVSLFFWKNRKKVDKFDLWLDRMTEKEEFSFYTPQSGMNFFYLFANHPKCRSFSYIEEGLCSYLTPEKLMSQKKQSILRDFLYRINFKNRCPSIKHFFNIGHPKFKTCYGVSQFSFPKIHSTTQLNLSVTKKNTLEYKHIIVLGPYVEFKELTQESFIKFFEYLVDYLIANSVNEVHIKFHPAQTQASSITILKSSISKYSSKIKIIELPPETILEEIAFNSDASFYLFLSSVGIYALFAGNQVFSIAKHLAKSEAEFKRKLDTLPDFYKEKLVYI